MNDNKNVVNFCIALLVVVVLFGLFQAREQLNLLFTDSEYAIKFNAKQPTSHFQTEYIKNKKSLTN